MALEFKSSIEEIKKDIEKYGKVRIFVQGYAPIRIQEIFSKINSDYGLDVVEVIVLEGNLLLICTEKISEKDKTILELMFKSNNRTIQE